MNEDLFFLGIKGVLRNKKGEILLLKVNTKKFNSKNKFEYWDIPGGRIQTGDTVEDTLRREIKEETGLKDIKNIVSFSMVLSNIRIPNENKSHGLILSTYLCETGKPNSIVLSDEHTEYGWFDSKDASEKLKIKYPKEFIEKVATL